MSMPTMKYFGHINKFQCNFSRILLIAFIICFVFAFECVTVEASNLISNPGFESGSDGKPTNWYTIFRKTGNSVQWQSEDVYSGQKAMKLVATVAEDPGKGVSVYKDLFEAPEDVMLELTAMIKTKDIVSGGGYYKGRIIIYMHDSEKNKILHRDIQFDGSIPDWTKFTYNIITPKGTRYVWVAFNLTSCTGTMWVDDVNLSIVQQPPTVSLTGIYNPVIIPSPWKAKYGSTSYSVGSLAIVIDPISGRQTYLEDSIKELVAHAGISSYRFFVPGESDITKYNTQLLIGDVEQTSDVASQFKTKFPDNTAKDVGDQGYFLSVTEGASQNVIYLGANTEQGRFYGVQTLKQALNTQSGPKAYTLDILDKPTLERRGVVMGVQWFSKQEQAISRLSGLKGNFVVNHGSYMNYKFGRSWRQDFTSSELTSMGNYLSLCKKHFVVPHINFGPQASDPNVDPAQFSSDGESKLIAEKIRKLYALGFRNFGINYDDLGNVGQDILLVEQDKKVFGNEIGKAHAYFAQSVFNQVIGACPGTEFTVLPMNYDDNYSITDKQQTYLKAFASLPSQIKLIAASVTDEGVQRFKGLTNRTITVWDNFFSAFESSDFSKEYTWPFLNSISWGNSSIKSSIDGFVFLPIIPAYEDPSIVSWRTAANYLWAPERYISSSSFQQAMAQYKGVGERVLIKAPENLKIR